MLPLSLYIKKIRHRYFQLLIFAILLEYILKYFKQRKHNFTRFQRISKAYQLRADIQLDR